MDGPTAELIFDEQKLARVNQLLRQVLEERTGLKIDTNVFDETFLAEDLNEAIRRLNAQGY